MADTASQIKGRAIKGGASAMVEVAFSTKHSPPAVVAAVIKQNSCATCTRFEKLGKVAAAADPPHGKCYKNFGSTVSVQSQEAIAAAEIFHSATEKMGYALTQRIGDNDPESFKKIVSSCPQYMGQIENALCTNHNGKNLYWKLTEGLEKELKLKFPGAKPADLGLSLQKAVEIVCGWRGALRMHNPAWKAAVTDADRAVEVQKYAEDIRIGWTHYAPWLFNHVYCCAEFCKVARRRAERKIKVRHNVHPRVLTTFGDQTRTCSCTAPASQPEQVSVNSEDAAFVKSLDVLVDAGLVDREALDAEMAEIRASVSQLIR